MADYRILRNFSALFAFAAGIVMPAAVHADQAAFAKRLSNGENVALNALTTGDQLAVRELEGEHKIAGHNVSFTGFSGVFGQSSDTAYILVASGHAGANGNQAKAGEVLVLMPYGGDALVQRFAARQFLQSWSEQAVNAHPDIYERFQKASKKQKWGLFFGRLEPTSFNVVAPGSNSQELARRSVVGSDAVQKIRFSGVADPEAIEREVVVEFVKALAAGDAATVASLMDPTPFGAFDLRGGADGARLLMANQLLASHDWPQRLESVAAERMAGNGKWRMANNTYSTLLGLRPVGDFIYVQTINSEH